MRCFFVHKSLKRANTKTTREKEKNVRRIVANIYIYIHIYIYFRSDALTD